MPSKMPRYCQKVRANLHHHRDVAHLPHSTVDDIVRREYRYKDEAKAAGLCSPYDHIRLLQQLKFFKVHVAIPFRRRHYLRTRVMRMFSVIWNRSLSEYESWCFDGTLI